MKTTDIRTALGDNEQVNIYVNYLQHLLEEKDKEGLKNPWVKSTPDITFVNIYKKVATDGLYIDGDTITLQKKYGKIVPDYSYHAYRKKLLMVYPETKIDIQCKYKGEKFDLHKDSGKVFYTHEMGDPFNQSDETIEGAYCIVKNNLGEFVEILPIKEAMKMKEVAKIKDVWDTWLSRMILKSVIKRLCKQFFYDHFKNIEELDNQNYDLDQSGKTDEESEELQLQKQFKDLMRSFNDEFKKYTGEDKEQIKAKYVKLGDDKTIDNVKPLYNRVKYGNLLQSYNGPGKENYLTALDDEITDDMLTNLINVCHG